MKQGFTSVAIGVNADSLATWFFEAFAPVLAERGLLCELLIDNEDLIYERLQRGEVLGCVTSLEVPFPGSESDYLGKMRYRCLCTPEFRKKYFARGISAEAVRAAPTLVFDRNDKMLDRFLRKHLGSRITQYSSHRVPSTQAYLDVVSRGLAYGLIPDLQLKDELRLKKLVDLAPGETVDVKLYFHAARRDTRTWREIKSEFIARARDQLAD